MSLVEQNVSQARIALVNNHLLAENRHDLDAVMATFGASGRYDDEPWEDHRQDLEGVRAYYMELMRALPDLSIEATNRHVSPESVILEVIIRGTHLGPWRGLPPTGKRLAFPLCGIYTFDEDNRIAGERIYYDRAAVLRQIGLFHEPLRGLGRVATALSHPVTIAGAYLRRLIS